MSHWSALSLVALPRSIHYMGTTAARLTCVASLDPDTPMDTDVNFTRTCPRDSSFTVNQTSEDRNMSEQDMSVYVCVHDCCHESSKVKPHTHNDASR